MSTDDQAGAAGAQEPADAAGAEQQAVPAVGSPTPPPGAERLPWLGRRFVTDALIHAGITLVGGFVLSAIVVALALAAVLLGILPSVLPQQVASSVDPAASGSPLVVLGLVFLAFGAALWGGVGYAVHAQAGLFHTTVSGSVGVMPFVLTGAILALVLVTGRILEARAPLPGQAARWAASGVTGLGSAIVFTLLAWAATVRVSADGVSGLTVTAAGLRSFVGVAVLVTAAAFAGRLLQALAPGERFGRSVRIAFSRVPRVVGEVGGTAMLGAIVFGVITLVAGFVVIGGTIGYGQAALTAPLWLGSAVVAAVAVGTLGGVQISLPGTHLGVVGVFTGSGLLWLLVLAALLVALVAGVRIGVTRAPGSERRLAGAWLLPAASAAAWLVFSWLFAYGFATGSADFGIGSAIWVFPAWWGFLTIVVFGCIVEVVARFGAAIALSVLPGFVRLLARTTTPDAAWARALGLPVAPWAPADRAAASTSAPAGEPSAGADEPSDAVRASVGPVAVPVRTMSPTTRKRVVLWSIVGAGVIVVVAGVSIAVSVVNHAVFSPAATATKYVEAIADGNAGVANSMLEPDVSTSGRALLTDASLKAAKARITDPEVVTTTVDGDRASVAVTYRLDGRVVHRSVELRRDGRTAVVFDHWRLVRGLVGQVSVQAEPGRKITVGSVSRTASSDGEVNLAAYPGAYAVSVRDDTYFSAAPATVFAGGAAAQHSGAVLEFHITDAFKHEVTAQVKKHIDGCAASTEASPAGCELDLWTFGEISGLKWKVTNYPTLEFRDDGSFDSTTPATVQGTYTQKAFGETSHEKDEVQVPIFGTAKEADGALKVVLEQY